MEEIIIKKLTEEQVSAVNTAAAMVAAVATQDKNWVQPKLEALLVAFKSYQGSWDYKIRDVSLQWSNGQMFATRGSFLGMDELHSDFYVRAVVADHVEKICLEFTRYLNLLLVDRQKLADDNNTAEDDSTVKE